MLCLQIFQNYKKRDEDLLAYSQHLTALHSDFSQRFEDILHINIPNWVLDLFSSRQMSPYLYKSNLLKYPQMRS